MHLIFSFFFILIILALYHFSANLRIVGRYSRRNCYATSISNIICFKVLRQIPARSAVNYGPLGSITGNT